MKVLVFVKATSNSEQGIKPSPEKLSRMFADMGKFNEALIKAGILQDGDGLKPSKAGKRIKFSDNGATVVIDGPFAETKELVAGYWVWNVKSLDEAVQWAKRCPNPMPEEEGVLEIRPTYSAEEFEEFLAGDPGEGDAGLRTELKRQQKMRTRSESKAKRAPARKKSKPARARSKK
jgi:hypothetical protein